MKLKRDAITGIVGIIGSLIYLVLIQVQTTQPPNLLEPGPRLFPYVAFIVVLFSSVMLLIKGLKDWKKDPKPDKPYFPKGGRLKITKSYLMLVLTAVAMSLVGFAITAPFATFAFIYDLKGETKIKPVPTAIIALVATAALYAMFVYGFQVKLPAGVLFS